MANASDIHKYPNPGQAAEVLAYIEKGTPLSSFLEAIVRNDLKGACEQADHVNQPLVWQILYWFHNYAPRVCWGTEANHKAWIERGGLKGRLAGNSPALMIIDDPHEDGREWTKEQREEAMAFFTKKLPSRLTENARVVPGGRFSQEDVDKRPEQVILDAPPADDEFTIEETFRSEYPDIISNSDVKTIRPNDVDGPFFGKTPGD